MGKLGKEAADKARKNGKLGGRPPGSKSPATIDRDEAIRQFRERVSKNASTLFDLQMGLAKGAQYLLRIDKEWVKTGTKRDGQENGFWRNLKPVRVENPEEMRQYLEDEFCNGDAEDDQDPSAAYYFLVAKDPSNQAIDSMLDRTFGRAKSELEVNVNIPKPIYNGLSQKEQKKLPPKKVKATIISTDGKSEREVQEA